MPIRNYLGKKGGHSKILEYLDKWGIPAVVSTGTGVIATLEGARNKDVVLGIRADIDALPLTEAAHPPYVSQIKDACTPAVMIRILPCSL